MNLYLSSSNLHNLAFVSSNGTGKYVVTTIKHSSGPHISTVQWAAQYLYDDSLIGEIEWKTHRGGKTLVRGPLVGADRDRAAIVGLGVLTSDFLYKKKTFGSLSRYFIGNDGQEYRWKPDIYNKGLVLTHSITNVEAAHFLFKTVPTDGIYAGEPRSLLCIQPATTLDLDLVILSFLIMETKRRERLGDMIHEDEGAGMFESGGDC